MRDQWKIILFFLLIFISFPVFPQGSHTTYTPAELDLLRTKAKSAEEDCVKVGTLLSLGEGLYESQPDSAMLLWYSGKLIAEKNIKLLEEKKQKGKELYMFYFAQLADAINNIAIIEDQRGNTNKALELFEQGLKMCEGVNDKQGIAQSLNNIGGVYKNRGDISKATEIHLQSLKVWEELGNKKGLATVLNNLAYMYKTQGETGKAIEYYKKSLSLRQEVGDKQGTANSFNNLGGIYRDMNDNKTAMEYYNKSFLLYKETNHKKGMGLTLNNIGFIYKNRKEFSKALNYNLQALKLREEIDDKAAIANSTGNIGQVYEETGDYRNALKYALRSYEIGTQLGFPESIKTASGVLKTVYEKTGHYKEALKMFELNITMRDSLNNQETRKNGIRLQLKYDYEKKSAADSVKNAEQQKIKDAQLQAQNAQIKNEKFQRYALIGGLAIVVLGLAFVINRFRITQKQKKIIEAQKIIVDEAFHKLAEKNKEVLDSIHYAKRIQTALITSEKYIDKTLSKLKNKL